MIVDEEIVISGNGRALKVCSQSSLARSDDVFYSCHNSQSLVMADERECSQTLAADGCCSADATSLPAVPQTISKESIPEPAQLERLEAMATPVRRRSLTLGPEGIQQEFDPLGLIAFDSPSRFAGTAAAKANSSFPLPASMGPSLLDVELLQSTPGSVLRYSQRDFDALRAEFERRAEKQAEFLQFEIQSIQERYDKSLQANRELNVLLNEYERTMSQILGTRPPSPSRPLFAACRCTEAQVGPSGYHRTAPAGQAAARR